MKRVAMLLVMTIGLALTNEAASQNPGKEDAAKLQGAWAIVSVEIDGQPMSMDKLKDSRLTITGKKYSFVLGKAHLEFTYKLDASKTPKTIDLKVAEEPEKGKVYCGIYQLEANRYKICRTTEPDKDRPTEFATRPNSGFMIVVWERQNPAGQ